jgi:hypothetical protein
MHFCRSCYLVVVPLWHPTLINNAQFVFSYRSSSSTSLKQAAETDDEKRRRLQSFGCLCQPNGVTYKTRRARQYSRKLKSKADRPAGSPASPYLPVLNTLLVRDKGSDF